MPEQVKGFWGKLKFYPDGKLQAWLPLSDHCRDVAVTFRTLLKLPIIRKRLDKASRTTLSDTHCDRLAVLAFLHDIGKANIGFQDKAFNPQAPRVGHIREIAPLLDSLLFGSTAKNAVGIL